ncbi:calmodulin-dependent protein kinase [Gigaspora margarita]|uniref:Calmodulin-dependent protein kinase n=1 Tax=Gigaspora margarita TaxID=4874 RepID=A0A8H4EQP1_GIGMA|nr:calmodulin-dependent protein kinase [Gigaspora margarita]
MGATNGIYNIGCFYNEGIGVKKDEQKAFEYYQKSADMGDSNEIFNRVFALMSLLKSTSDSKGCHLKIYKL